MADITAAVGEDMQVRDSASEEVRRTRNRCRTIEGRLRSILKSASGEVSEQVTLHLVTSAAHAAIQDEKSAGRCHAPVRCRMSQRIEGIAIVCQ